MSQPVKSVLVICLLWSAHANAGEAQTAPWLEPDVLAASLEIGMDEAQIPQFRMIVSEFINEQIKALNKLLRGHNVTDMERKMKSRTNALKRNMDKQMSALLTEEQYPRYETYRDLLISKYRS